MRKFEETNEKENLDIVLIRFNYNFQILIKITI